MTFKKAIFRSDRATLTSVGFDQTLGENNALVHQGLNVVIYYTSESELIVSFMNGSEKFDLEGRTLWLNVYEDAAERKLLRAYRVTYEKDGFVVEGLTPLDQLTKESTMDTKGNALALEQTPEFQIYSRSRHWGSTRVDEDEDGKIEIAISAPVFNSFFTRMKLGSPPWAIALAAAAVIMPVVGWFGPVSLPVALSVAAASALLFLSMFPQIKETFFVVSSNSFYPMETSLEKYELTDSAMDIRMTIAQLDRQYTFAEHKRLFWLLAEQNKIERVKLNAEIELTAAERSKRVRSNWA